jgi:hypothetical protein
MVGSTADWLILKSTQSDEALHAGVVEAEIAFRISDSSPDNSIHTAARRKWVYPTK